MSPPLHPAPEYAAACWIVFLSLVAVAVLATVLPALL